MVKYNIANETWWVQYFYAVYFSSTIISTVGFGDMTVANVNEAILLTSI